MWLKVMAARIRTTSGLASSGKGEGKGRWRAVCAGGAGGVHGAGNLDHASIQAATPWRSSTTSPSRLAEA
jgi:hypothetical protein